MCVARARVCVCVCVRVLQRPKKYYLLCFISSQGPFKHFYCIIHDTKN